MAVSKKGIENANRLRYIRALERFHKSILSFLSSENEITIEGFDKKISNSLRVLQRVEVVQIYKGELQDLQKLVIKILGIRESLDSIEDIKNDILYASNQLDKSKNAKRYKKDKHINSKYKEWE